MHGRLAAVRAETDIKPPGSLEQILHGKPDIAGFHTAPVLKLRDQVEVLRLGAVIEKAIVTDLAKTGRKHVHEKTAYKLMV